MNDADRKAFEEWWTKNSGWNPGNFDAWEAACEWCGSQAGEPVAWMVYLLDGESVCVTDNPNDFTENHRALPLYTTPLTAQINQQLVDFVQNWLNLQGNDDNYMTAKAKSILAAAKETK